MSDELSIKTPFLVQIAEKLREYNIKIDDRELNEMYFSFIQAGKSVDTDAFVRELENKYGIEITQEDRQVLRSPNENADNGEISKPSQNKKVFNVKKNVSSKKSAKRDENLEKLISNGSINTALTGVLTTIVETEEKKLNSVKENSGKISGLWNGVKNLFGTKTCSDKVEEKIKASKDKISLLKANPGKLPEIYREITGNTLNTEEIDAIYNGNVDYSKSDIINSVTKYESSQKNGINVISGVTSVLSVTGVLLSGAIAAPFTGGLSLGASVVSLGILGATGAAGYMIPQAIDGLTEKDGYSGQEILEDTAHALLNGTVNALSAGVGNAVGSAVGKTAAESVVASGAESAVAESAGLAIENGSVAARLIQSEASALTSGNAMAAGEYIIETAKDDEHDFSIKELGKTLITASSASVVAGAAASGLSSAAGKTLTDAATSECHTFGKILSGGVIGAVSGTTGAMAAGGTDYLINCIVNGEDADFNEWLKAASKNAETGALTGFAAGMAFEAVHIASGASAPKGSAVSRDGETENGLKYTEYLDSDGNIIARDIDSQELTEYVNKNSNNKIETTAYANNEKSTVRITFNAENAGRGEVETGLNSQTPVETSVEMPETTNNQVSNGSGITEQSSENVAVHEPKALPKPAGGEQAQIPDENSFATVETAETPADLLFESETSFDDVSENSYNDTEIGNEYTSDEPQNENYKKISDRKYLSPNKRTELEMITDSLDDGNILKTENNNLLSELQEPLLSDVNKDNLLSELDEAAMNGIDTDDLALIEEKIPVANNEPIISEETHTTAANPVGTQNNNDYTGVEAGAVVNAANEQTSNDNSAQSVYVPVDTNSSEDNQNNTVNQSSSSKEENSASDKGSQIEIKIAKIKTAGISAKKKAYIGEIVKQKISSNKHVKSVSEKNMSEIINAVNAVHNYCVNLGINIAYDDLSEIFDKLGCYDNPSKFTNMFFSMNQENLAKTIVSFLMEHNGFDSSDVDFIKSMSVQNIDYSDIARDMYAGDDISDKKAELKHIASILMSAVKNGNDIEKIKAVLLKFKNRYDLSAKNSKDEFNDIGNASGLSAKKDKTSKNNDLNSLGTADFSGLKHISDGDNKNIKNKKSASDEKKSTLQDITANTVAANVANYSGMKYTPEEGDTKKITKRTPTGVTETVYSKSKEIKTQTTVKYDKNSNPVRITSVSKSEKVPGCYETKIYSGKKEKQLSYTKTNDDGSVSYKEKINYRGKTTEKSYTLNKKSVKYNYKIEADNGKKLLEVKRKFNLCKNGSSTTIVDGKKYKTMFDDKNLMVNLSCDDGKKVFIDLNHELVEFTPQQKQNLFEALKTMPADSMFQIKSAIKYFDNKKGVFTSKDFQTNNSYKNNDNVATDNETKQFLNIVISEHLNATSTELSNIFKKEMNIFKKVNPELAKDFINNSLYLKKTDGNIVTAITAECNGLLYTPETMPESGITRSQILEEFFPETIAEIANLTRVNSVNYLK